MSRIDDLEAQLRKAHERDRSVTFQFFVDTVRGQTRHPLHMIAVEYERRVHAMQQRLSRRGTST